LCHNKDIYTNSLLHIPEFNHLITFTDIERRIITMSWLQIRMEDAPLLSITGYISLDRTVAVGTGLLPP